VVKNLYRWLDLSKQIHISEHARLTVSHSMGCQNYSWKQRPQLLSSSPTTSLPYNQPQCGRSVLGRGTGFGRALKSRGWRRNRPSSSQAIKKKSHKISTVYSRELKRGFTTFPSSNHRHLLKVSFFCTSKRKLNLLPHARIQTVVYSLEETAGPLCRSILYHMGIYPVGFI